MSKHLGIAAFAFLVMLLVTLSSSPAQADGFGCSRWGYSYPADLTPLYSTGAIPLPPYFALHPPVYYDVPVPRTYGYSPWAYMPEVRTPEIVTPEPEIIQNKYVPQLQKPADEKPKTAAAPLRISNPFVSEIGQTVENAVASR